MQKIQQIIARLQQTNERAFYLAFLRVAVSAWYLKEMLLRWPALGILYSNSTFLKVAPARALKFFHLDVVVLKEHYMLIAYACMLLLLLNVFGIGRNVTSFLLFLVLALLNNMNYQFYNAGDKMALMLTGYLAVANTFSYFTLFKRKPFGPPKEKVYNLLSNLAAYSIIINVCLAYFFAGVYKLFDPFWQKGTALHYFLNYDRFSVLAAGGYVHFPMVFLYIINYGTMALELCFPVLVFYNKRWRNITLGLLLLMHIGIYSFLMVFAMSVIFVMQYGMFYSDEEVLAAVSKIRAPFLKHRNKRKPIHNS